MRSVLVFEVSADELCYWESDFSTVIVSAMKNFLGEKISLIFIAMGV